MIAFLTLVYTAVVVLLFKLKLVKPSAVSIAGCIVAGVVLLGGVVVNRRSGTRRFGNVLVTTLPMRSQRDVNVAVPGMSRKSNVERELQCECNVV
jgi:hypothetical protein